MGFRFQKSIKLGKLFKLNLSKSGVGVSGGVKGFRLGTGPRGQKMSFNIPGTGMSYVKHFNVLKKKKDKKSDPKAKQFEKEIKNEYLGLKKVIKANSEWELELKEKAQLEKWAKKEEMQRKRDSAGDMKKQAEQMTEEVKAKIEEMNGILEHTLHVDDKLDWKAQKKKEKGVSEWKKAFEDGEVEAIEKYAEVVLGNSIYPEEIEQDYEVDYVKEDKLLIISYKLPGPDEISNIEEYKYISSKNEIVPKNMTSTEFENYYSNIVYQMTLRSIHEMFEAFYTDSLDVVVFNGWVTHTDKATGNDSISCLISVCSEKEDFEKINLEKIDYKACLSNFKGSFSKKFTKVSPIMPLVDMDNYDSEFIEEDDE